FHLSERRWPRSPNFASNNRRPTPAQNKSPRRKSQSNFRATPSLPIVGFSSKESMLPMRPPQRNNTATTTLRSVNNAREHLCANQSKIPMEKRCSKKSRNLKMELWKSGAGADETLQSPRRPEWQGEDTSRAWISKRKRKSK